MPEVDRFSITMPPQLGKAVRAAAARRSASVSAWLSEAAADRLRNDLLGEALAAWQQEGGPFTSDELNDAVVALDRDPGADLT